MYLDLNHSWVMHACMKLSTDLLGDSFIFSKLSIILTYPCARFCWYWAITEKKMSHTLVLYIHVFLIFFQYKTNVNVEVRYVRSIDYPSVSICNQNNYRLEIGYPRGVTWARGHGQGGHCIEGLGSGVVP